MEADLSDLNWMDYHLELLKEEDGNAKALYIRYHPSGR